MRAFGAILLSLAVMSLPARAEDWEKEAKDRAKRAALHGAAQRVRGDSGKWSDEARLLHAPPTGKKPPKMLLDAWADGLAEKKGETTEKDDNWLLFRTAQLDDNDRLWVERIERRGNRIAVFAVLAKWKGKYFRNFTYHQLVGVNLGLLEPGKYEARWVVRPASFVKFAGDGKMLDDNWPADERPTERKPTELRFEFTVGKSPR